MRCNRLRSTAGQGSLAPFDPLGAELGRLIVQIFCVKNSPGSGIIETVTYPPELDPETSHPRLYVTLPTERVSAQQ